MYGSLTGSVTATLGNKTLIDVAGVGYWVHTGSWIPIGITTTYLHHHVREDSSDLYGFPDIPSLSLFEKLLTVPGIGPKAALGLLSIGSAAQLKRAIVGQDTGYLSSAPGIGSKAAQKIVLELSNKLDGVSLAEDGGSNLIVDTELRMALESLGYKPQEINRIIGEVPKEILGLEAQLRWALQQLTSLR